MVTKSIRTNSCGKLIGSGRNTSVSPCLNTSRNPNSLMTTSCMVGFGSSAPRSICTQSSPAALRLKQAFEARLASYLTGRHSGCFFTRTASPFYSCFLDPCQLPYMLKNENKTKNMSNKSLKYRRAVSAHTQRSNSTRHHVTQSHAGCIKSEKNKDLLSTKDCSQITHHKSHKVVKVVAKSDDYRGNGTFDKNEGLSAPPLFFFFDYISFYFLKYEHFAFFS